MSTKARYVNGILRYFESDTHETSGPVAPVSFYDDFLQPSLVIPAVASLESGVDWAKKIVGAAPPTVAGVANETNGIVRCALTADVQKQDAGLYFGDQLTLSAVQGLVFEARVKISTLPTLNAEAVWGVTSAWADGPDAITYSAFFTADGSGEVICESDDNATDQSATSGVTATNAQWKIYRIDFSDVTSVKFYIDGAQVAAGTTFPWAASAANSKVQPYLGLYKVGDDAGVGAIDIDYVRLFQKRA
jgi:hypothetical protein